MAKPIKKIKKGDADFRSNIAVVNGQERDGKGCGTNDEPDGGEPRDGRRFLNDEVELLDVPEEHVSRDLAAQEDGVGLGAAPEKLLRSSDQRRVSAVGPLRNISAGGTLRCRSGSSKIGILFTNKTRRENPYIRPKRHSILREQG